MKFLILCILIVMLAACGAHYSYQCTTDDGKTALIEIRSLRDVEDGVRVHIRDCGQNVTIETSGLDNGHAEAQEIAKAIVPLAKAAAGGIP
jgi:uncharacterized protein YxeA